MTNSQEYPYPGLAAIKKSEGPRMIKTHLPFSLLPKSVSENGTKVSCLIQALWSFIIVIENIFFLLLR